MATANSFYLLGDDTEDPLLLAQQKLQKPAVTLPLKKTSSPQISTQQKSSVAKMPSKPLPPAQAVREGRGEYGRGSRQGGRGQGRGGGGVFPRDFNSSTDSHYNSSYGSGGGMDVPRDNNATSERSNERRGGHIQSRGGFRGVSRGAYNNEDGERLQRRSFDRHSGTGRGNEIKREGSGRRNWGTQADDIVNESEEVGEMADKIVEKPSGEEESAVNVNKKGGDSEEIGSEDKKMTLEEYEKIREEKRKAAAQGLKMEERKVDAEKEFGDMQPLSSKKSSEEDVFMKVGSEKEKRKDNGIEKEDKGGAKKSPVSINEFLRPAEGERYFRGGGRGRGRGGRGTSGIGDNVAAGLEAPSIADPGQFPSLAVGK